MQKSNMLNLEVDPKWPKDPVKIFLQVWFEDFQRGGGLYTRGKTFQNLGAAMEEALPRSEQEQKTRPGVTPVSWEQQTEATIHTSSPNLDNRRLKNVSWSDEFLLQYLAGRGRIWREQHESVDPSWLVSAVQTGAGGVMVWEIYFCGTLII